MYNFYLYLILILAAFIQGKMDATQLHELCEILYSIIVDIIPLIMDIANSRKDPDDDEK